MFSVLTGLILGNAAYLFGEPLLNIYAPGEPDVVAQGMSCMFYICLPYFICGIMDTMVGVLRDLGYSVVPMIASLVGMCGLRLLWVAYIFPLNRVPTSLYFSYLITWIITGLFHVIFFLAIRRHAYQKSERYNSKLSELGRSPS